jgi:hypothetical protein
VVGGRCGLQVLRAIGCVALRCVALRFAGGQNRGTGHDAHPVLPGGAHAGAAHGQRPFERRSGSGRGREQRKGGAGGYAAGVYSPSPPARLWLM